MTITKSNIPMDIEFAGKIPSPWGDGPDAHYTVAVKGVDGSIDVWSENADSESEEEAADELADEALDYVSQAGTSTYSGWRATFGYDDGRRYKGLRDYYFKCRSFFDELQKAGFDLDRYVPSAGQDEYRF